MSTIHSITLGAQLTDAGILIPVTVEVSGNAVAPTYLTAQFRDVVLNTADSVCQKITNFKQGATTGPLTTFTATLEMTELTASQIFKNDFTSEVQVTVFRGDKSHSKVGLYWLSPMQDVAYTAVAGGEKITLYIEANPNYINVKNLEGLTAQVQYSATGIAFTTKNLAITPVTDSSTNYKWTAVLDQLVNGVQYELSVGLENAFGVEMSHTSLKVMPSFNPSTVSIVSFDSLDPSGGRFTFNCAAFDYSRYSALKLKGKMAQGLNGGEAFEIDICGNSLMPSVNKSTTIVYNKPLSSSITQGKFDIEVSIVGTIAIDASGLVQREYSGVKTTKTYIQDENMSAPVVTLSEIDWVSGTQKVKAVLDGSFANVTFSFDLSGSISSTTMYDMCGTTLKMTAIKEYSYSELSNYRNGVKVSVRASRPELNGGATPSVTQKVELADALKAIKRAPAPVVNIDLQYGNKAGAILKFANIDASFTSLLGEITLGDVVKVSEVDEDASGAVMDLSGDSLVSGTRYLVAGYSRLNLTSAGYANHYKTLNKNDAELRSIATSSQYVYTGAPTIKISYRPRDASTNVLNTLRIEGDKKGNNVNQIMAIARDVSGQIQQATLIVSANTTDSCGNRLFQTDLADRVGNYTHDFTFAKQLDISETQFAFGLLDTPTALDAVTTTVAEVDATRASTFVTAVNEYNVALSAYNVALDASNNPTTDKDYNTYVAQIANYDISINDLSNAILGATLVRDGSNSGSLWYKDHQTALFNSATVAYGVAVHNTGVVSGKNQTLLQNLLSASDSADVEIRQTVQEVTLQFLINGKDISNQTISVPKFPTNGAYYNAETALAHYLSLMTAEQDRLYAAKNAAEAAKIAAETAHTNNNTLISTKDAERTTAVSNRGTAVTNRDTRVSTIVSTLAANKLTLFGADGKSGKAGALKTAHASFAK